MSVDIAKHQYAVAFIACVVLVDAICFGIILPVMPKLIMNLTGSGTSEAARLGGYMMLAYAVVQFFAAPLLGAMGDRYGRRPILLFSLAVLGIDYLLIALADNLMWLLIARLIAGVASSTFSVAYAYITDITPVEQRAQRFGIVGAGFGLGFILGPVVGGALADISMHAPFIAAATLALANLAYGYFALGESLTKDNRRIFDIKRANPIGSLIQVGKYPIAKDLATIYLLFMLGQVAMPSYWAYFAIEKFAWSEAQIGVSLGFAGFVAIFAQGVLLRFAVPAFGYYMTGIIGLSAAIFAYLGYAFAESSWQVYVFIVVAAPAGFVLPTLQSIMTNQMPPNAQGELQGILGGLNSIAIIIGPASLTYLFSIFNGEHAILQFPGVAFVVTAALCVVCLLKFKRVLGSGLITSS